MKPARDVVCWFTLAVSSLAMAGLFSLVLVVGRVPFAASGLLQNVAFAHRSLIVHVNLAMGVWFFACLAGLFCLLPGTRRVRTAPIAIILATIGTVGFTIPAFTTNATPILSNYVPVIDHWLFLSGLVIFACGIMLNFIDPRIWPISASSTSIPPDAQQGLRGAAFTFLIAMLTIGGAWVTQNAEMPSASFYERLFWGGGHVLQAANTLSMLAIWLILLYRLTGRTTLRPRLAGVLCGLILLPILPSPWLTFGNYSGRWFTHMMEFGLFPVTLILLACGIASLWQSRDRLTLASFRTVAFVGLATSVTLTLVGFVLGAMIAADTTLIPAHYHANIGAVTVAYMTVLVILLPQLGAAIPWPRLATWQPLLYGTGQIIFVLGLAIAGTLGQAARKTYGQESQINSSAELAGLMLVGIGGLIALAGGIFYIAIMAHAASKVHRELAPSASSSLTDDEHM